MAKEIKLDPDQDHGLKIAMNVCEYCQKHPATTEFIVKAGKKEYRSNICGKCANKSIREVEKALQRAAYR